MLAVVKAECTIAITEDIITHKPHLMEVLHQQALLVDTVVVAQVLPIPTDLVVEMDLKDL